MKKTILAVAFGAVLFTTSSCVDKLAKFTEFDIPYKTTLTIPQVPVAPVSGIFDSLNVSSPDIPTLFSSYLSDNQTAKDLLDSVNLKSLNLLIKSPTTGNFNFLKSIKLYISSSTLPEKVLATRDSIPQMLRTLDFSTRNSPNLRSYLEQPNFKIRLVAVPRAASDSTIKVEMSMKFHVNARVLGQ